MFVVTTYLDAIADFHRRRAAGDLRNWHARRETLFSQAPSLVEALSSRQGHHIKVIAEIKRRSPSQGWLREDVDAPRWALMYQESGASAISVLTDEPHFGGSLEDLRSVAASVDIPTLRKDFTISENDVLDAVECGASAVLLIAALLDDTELSALHALSLDVGLSALVEVHDVAEVRRARQIEARIIGVNQRNLHTFVVDADHAARVVAAMPSDVVRVAESGLRDVSDVERAAAAGFDAVLVGESFIRSPSPARDVALFSGVEHLDR